MVEREEMRFLDGARPVELLLAGLLAAAASGCVFIIGPDGPAPVPVPTPLACTPENTSPTAHVYFSVRIERSTVNMVSEYTQLMTRVVTGLAGAGIQTTQALLVRADERPGGAPLLAAWGCRLDSPDTLRPEDVLMWYATQETLDDGPLSCATDPLVRLGSAPDEVVTQYPPGLVGTNGRSVFGAAPELVLVVHLDGLARRTAYAADACGSARTLAALDAGTPAWLRYEGEPLAADRVTHWFIHTPEEVERAAFVDACRRQEGFPSDLLDNLEPSALALYGPLADALDATPAGVARASLCELLADDRKFLVQALVAVAGRAGISANAGQVGDVLDNGLPLPDGEEPPETGVRGR